MGDIFHSSVTWLQGHPLSVSFILFGLATVISIYASDIKRFLHSWPRSRKTILAINRNKATHTLNLLKVVHNNPYQLLMYFIWNIVSVVVTAFYINAGFIAVAWISTRKLTVVSIWPTMAGIALVRTFEVRNTLRQLYDYDASVKELEQTIRDYEALQK